MEQASRARHQAIVWLRARLRSRYGYNDPTGAPQAHWKALPNFKMTILLGMGHKLAIPLTLEAGGIPAFQDEPMMMLLEHNGHQQECKLTFDTLKTKI